MKEDFSDRMNEGKELEKDHLVKVVGMTDFFLSAVKGFRRDLALSIPSCPDYLEADFLTLPNGLVVPPMPTAKSFGDLSKMLTLSDDALNGTIKLKNPKFGPDQGMREKLLEEALLTHKNLMDVADTANRMYQTIQTAGFEFDVFNSNNIEVGHADMNIVFDRDELYLASATARALGERAVRLDIDLVEGIERLQTGQNKVTI
ncbi:MAG: hypothetical protein WCG55_04375 [bacterium]